MDEFRAKLVELFPEWEDAIRMCDAGDVPGLRTALRDATYPGGMSGDTMLKMVAAGHPYRAIRDEHLRIKGKGPQLEALRRMFDDRFPPQWSSGY